MCQALVWGSCVLLFHESSQLPSDGELIISHFSDEDMEAQQGAANYLQSYSLSRLVLRGREVTGGKS